MKIYTNISLEFIFLILIDFNWNVKILIDFIGCINKFINKLVNLLYK